MAMKAIPMKGRLTGKRVFGCLWAGRGKSWSEKENYFQLEHDQQVSVVLGSPSGEFWVRCKGAACEIKLIRKGRVLATTVLAFPHGRK
jgi:hypothetical protein